MYCGDKLTVWEGELRGALSLGDMGMIKKRKDAKEEEEEEEGVQQGDKIKSSCGNWETTWKKRK